VLLCRGRKLFRRGAGNRFRKIDECVVFALAKILRLKKLGQTDDLRAFRSGVANARERFLQVVFWDRSA